MLWTGVLRQGLFGAGCLNEAVINNYRKPRRAYMDIGGGILR
jgi:hypothetical protein